MSSLRSQILSEIKKLLNEADTGDYRDTINKVIRAPQKELTRGALGPGELFPYLDLDDVDLSFSELRTLFTGIQTWTPPIPVEAAASFRKICRAENVLTSDGDFYYIYCKNEVPCAQFKLGRKSTPVPNLLGGYRGNKARTDIHCEYSGQSPQPKPPKPAPDGKCPEGYKTLVNEKGETNCVKDMPPSPGPVPSPGLKYPGCRKPQFVGKNGKISGPEVESVQRALEVFTMEKSSRGKFTYKGVSDNRGTYGPATEQAVYDFQKSEGGKFAAKIKTQLGSALGNPDGCVGPKTACALVMVAGGEVANYNLAKCKTRFGVKKIQRGVLAKTATPIGDVEAAAGMAESKNWIDRTREETKLNLFERLVKDAAKKVI